MPRKKINVANLLVELEEFQAEWARITADYGGQDPDRGPSDPGWDEITEVCYYVKNPSTETFAWAWERTLIPARELFLGVFTRWAAKVVEIAEVDRIPLNCGDPPNVPGHWPFSNRSSLPYILTGASDPIEAGLRLILWAAAYNEPAKCHRSAEYRELLFSWVAHLMQFGDGNCRTLREPFEWVRSALISLNPKIVKVKHTVETADPLVRDLLKACEKAGKKLTQRDLAKKIGCSSGLIAKLPAWEAYREKTKSAASAPRGEALTAGHLATIGAEDPELKQLLGEQEADCKADQLSIPRGERRGRRPKV